jgi:predicted MFS family arabinose efflux permease
MIKGGKESGKGFYDAKKAVTDKDNHIFLLNIHKDEGGYRIRREEIVEYSPEGRFLGVVFSLDHEEPVLAENIEGLYSFDGELAYIISGEASFDLYSKDNSLIKSFKLEGPAKDNISYAIQSGSKEVAYSTKQGKIYRYNGEGADDLLYDANTGKDLSIPREISFSPEGKLYFTDIGLRTVSELQEDGTVSQVIYEGVPGEDISSKYIYYYMDASNGAIAVTSGYIATLSQGGPEFTYDSVFDSMSKIIIIGDWAALLILALLGILISFKLAVLIVKKGSRVLKLSIAIILGVVCIAGLFLLIVLPDFESRLMDSELQRAEVVSDMTCLQLPTEAYKRLDSTADYMSEDYVAVRDSINGIYQSDTEGVGDFYCVLYSIREGVITGTYSLQEEAGAIYPYEWDYEGSDEQWIMANGKGQEYRGVSTSEGNFMFVLNPIFDEAGNTIGLVEVGTDLYSFHKETNRMIFELFLHVIAITVVIILIAMELVIFFHGRREYIRKLSDRQVNTPVKLPNDLLRILVFVIFFITNMTTSFLPLYALEIAEKSTILIPREVLAALPISAEVLFGAIFSIMGNVVIRKLGMKRSAALGSVLFTIGLLVRILIPNIWILTAGNAIMGSGWGILLLIVSSMIAMGNEEEKNKGYSGYSMAAMGGVNCGIVFGGFLVNWLSYKTIFLSAAAVSLIIVAHVAIYLRNASFSKEDNQEANSLEPISFRKFIISKGVLPYFLMIVIPVVACGYFLNYLYPILGSQYGLSETRIGYSYLFNGIFIICFGNVLTEYFTKKVKKAYSLVFASLLYAMAFLCVAYFHNVYSLIAVLVLLGISDSFGLPIQVSYYTDLEAVKRYGYDKSMGIYSLFENTAQAGGSFVFSYVLIIGVRYGLVLVLSIVAGLAVLFGVLNFVKSRSVKAVKEAETEL